MGNFGVTAITDLLAEAKRQDAQIATLTSALDACREQLAAVELQRKLASAEASIAKAAHEVVSARYTALHRAASAMESAKKAYAAALGEADEDEDHIAQTSADLTCAEASLFVLLTEPAGGSEEKPT